MSLRVSLVIPCFNASRTLPMVLAALKRQTRRPEEMIVIDDGSVDGSGALAEAAGVRVVRHPGNRGLAEARNTALAEAHGELLVFIDADAVPRPDLTARLCRGYEEDPTLCGVGGQVMEQPDGELADRWRARFWRQTQGEAPLARAPFLIGACCSLRRSAALRSGGFSEAYRTNGEDVELSIRLRQRGGRLAYDPLAQVLHLRHDTPGTLLRMVYRHSRDQVRALTHHGESARRVIENAVRWGPITVGSSLRRHRDPALAALSLPAHALSLGGCAVGWAMGHIERMNREST